MRLRLGPLVADVEGVDREDFPGIESLLGAFETTDDAHVGVQIDVRGERLRHWRHEDSVTFAADPKRRALFIRVVDWEAEFLLDERRTIVVMRDAWGPAFDQFLKSAAQVWLPVCGLGLAFHASAVRYEGRGLVFAARAETGKTTVARTLKEHGAAVLTEEMTCVAFGESLELHTLPQRERSSLQVQHPLTVRLDRFYALRQAAVDEVGTPPLGAALAALLRTVAIGVRDPMMIAPVFGLCETLSERVAIRSLSCRKGEGFVGPVRRDLGLM